MLVGLLCLFVSGAARADDPQERYREWLEDQRERAEEARERWEDRWEKERERYEDWLEDERERREDERERWQKWHRRQGSHYRYGPPAYYYSPMQPYAPYYAPRRGQIWFHW
jgi:hypothetical protein